MGEQIPGPLIHVLVILHTNGWQENLEPFIRWDDVVTAIERKRGRYGVWRYWIESYRLRW